MREIGLAALVLSAAAQIGCCKKILDHDYQHPPVVVDKAYEPAREYLGSKGETLQDDEDFIIFLRSDDGRQYHLYIGKDTYDRTKIGENIDLTRTRHQLLDPDYVKGVYHGTN